MYTSNSIVDYLTSAGQDPSFAARTNLAKQKGIQNYAGTADQNLQLLSLLRGASTPGGTSGGSTATPTAPVPDPTRELIKRAGGAGIGINDLPSILPADDPNGIRDELAKTYGYDSFDAFTQDVFTRPSKSTEDLYKQAYQSAGLDELLNKITEAKNNLNNATGSINENPWLDEASRVGRTKRLQELAQGDIGNLTDLYNARLDEVKRVTELGAADLSENERIKEARFNFLLQQAETEAQRRKANTFSKYLPDYLDSLPAGKPETITVGNSVYAWDANEGAFKEVISGKTDGFTLGDGQVRYDADGNVIASNKGGSTDIGAGIIGGYNIGSYATDPNHEANVARIFSQVGNISTAAQADAYIKKVAPKSPINGAMIVNAANQYGVDPAMLIAMMQQDSSLGTAGKALRTFNPGNVGNDDGGNTRNYGSWSAGVNAVAQWLSKAKVGGNPAFVQAAQNVQAGLTKDQRAAFVQNFNAAIAVDPKQAKDLIITTAINALPSADLKNKAFGRIQAIDELDRIQGLLNEYQAAGGNTGLLTGNQEQVFQKLGQTSNPALASIGNAIQASIIAYRNAVSGAAFTESEAKQYETMFPSTKKSFKLNTALIGSLKNTFNNQQRSALATVLGSYDTYDTLQKLPRAGQTITVQGKAYRVAPDGDTLIPLFSQKQ